MWKNLFKYLLIAMFASFIAIGCGDDDDDGGPSGTSGAGGDQVKTISVSGTVDNTGASTRSLSSATLQQADPGQVVVYNAQDGTELGTADIDDDGSFTADITKPNSNQFALLFEANYNGSTLKNLSFFDLTSNPGNLVGNIAKANIMIDLYSTGIANKVLGEGNNKFPEGETFASMKRTFEDEGGVAFSFDFGNLELTGQVGEDVAGGGTPQPVNVSFTGESCGTCHANGGVVQSAADHQAHYDASEDTQFEAKISSVTPNLDNTTTVTFSVTKNGDAYEGGFGEWTGGDDWDPFQLIWTSYDNTSDSFSFYTDFSFGPDVITNEGGGTYSVTFEPAVELKPNMTFFLVGAKAGGYANHDWLRVEEYINAVYVEGEVPAVDASVEGCNGCHMENVLKHNAISVTPIDQDGKVRPFFSCQSCHNNGRNAFHDVDIDGDGNSDSASLKNTVHWWHAGFDYPQSLSNCVKCHSDEAGGSLTKVVEEAFTDYDNCQTCHGDLVNKYGSHFDLDHTGWQDKDCYGCHDGSIGPTFAEIHNGGYSFEKADSDGTPWSEKVKFQIDDIQYDNNTNQLTVTWGAYENGALLDLSDNSTYDFDTDDLTNETGAYVLVGYLGFGSKDVVEDAMAETTINADGSATSTLTLDSAILSEYQVEGVKVGILGVPAVNGGTGDDEDGTKIAVTSVTKNYNLETGAEFDTGLAVSKAKCDSCHNELIIHDSGSHRHGAVANPDACMFCHNPASPAGHYYEQSRALDSYLHAYHEGQGAPAGEGMHEYPLSMGNCVKCHTDISAADIPNQIDDLGVYLSGSKPRPDRQNRATENGVITGPAAVACGSCHRAYAISHDRDTSSLNAHTGQNGYRVPSETMPYLDVITNVLMNR